ncbi:glucose-6-phosphate isomerase [Methanolinea mesophila]|uniref:glucose-6-phosphate isomerase family protein n=1 Tax=Methanolinea mesophila TaxID=547055 RepID=UPI001AEAD280|nr:glucose-6-phosphate isomerase family protein [Methanolinea mesophila]MBP1929325.1 glucose-6-phosphate isomerase [Methanolinea mesophila]
MVLWGWTLPEPDIRTGTDMHRVLQSPACATDTPLYFMYRDLARSERDKLWLQSHNVRFDLTIIPPRQICGEFVKTKGHYHPKNAAGVGYPEIYEVISGEAHYLLQHRDLHDVVVIPAYEGDVVIIPPGYGHVTINPGSCRLSMCNLVSTEFRSEYEEFEQNQGAAYYEQCDGSFVKNSRYRDLPPLRIAEPSLLGNEFREINAPLYELVGHGGELPGLLNNPERYLDRFSRFRPD